MPRDTDLYADSCHRIARDHVIGSTASAAAIDAIIPFYRQVLLDACWTEAASGTENGHPMYKLDSQQSPHWDDENDPPANYIAKVRVKLFATSNVAMQIQAMTTDETVQQSTADNRTLHNINFGDGTLQRIIACPYQFATFRPDAADAGGFPRSAIVSAPHIARWIHEQFGIQEAIFASRNAFRDSVGSSANTVVFTHVKDNTGTYTNDSFSANKYGPSLLIPVAESIARPKILNAEDDPTFSDPTLWMPWASPAAMIWGDVSLPASPVADSNRIQMWLWDALGFSESYSIGSKITRPDGTIWEVYTLPGAVVQSLAIRSL